MFLLIGVAVSISVGIPISRCAIPEVLNFPNIIQSIAVGISGAIIYQAGICVLNAAILGM
jgi:hypothetical protein